MALGDVHAKVDWLADQPEPVEPTTRKIWTLLQQNWLRRKLVPAVLLLLEICWWTLTSEQQHASLATLKRLHPDYELSTLMARSTILQVNRLLDRPTDLEKLQQKLEAALAVLDRKVPERGRAANSVITSAFFKDQGLCSLRIVSTLDYYSNNIIRILAL